MNDLSWFAIVSTAAGAIAISLGVMLQGSTHSSISTR